MKSKKIFQFNFNQDKLLDFEALVFMYSMNIYHLESNDLKITYF